MSDIRKLLHHAMAVRRHNGKPYWRQLVELGKLVTGKQRLSPSEYYELAVFDDAAYPGAQKLDCVGWRASAQIDLKLNHGYWRAAANDKLLNYALLQHYGFTIPQTTACYSPSGRGIGAEPRIRSVEALADFLRDGLTFPIFIKPNHGSYGRGTYRFDSFDASGGYFMDSRGAAIKLDEVIATCTNPKFGGMLFQKCLQPHPEVRRLVGNTTSCVRVMVALSVKGPIEHLAFWKIARAHNITDNFCMGETGNLLAWVNKASGTVERVVTGLWPNGQDVDRHPDTGQMLVGSQLPDWQNAMAMCLAAAVNFPGLRLQHWDVAFCVNGPVLMELNTEADLGVPQYLGSKPFIDDVIRSML